MSIRHNAFGTLRALSALVGFVFFFSACNGKIDQDIDPTPGIVPVERVMIDQEDFEMMETETTVLTATVLPENATDKSVSWYSSNEEVVEITNTGRARAIASGASVITAKAGSKEATVTITIIPYSPSKTVGAEHISALSVVLTGEAKLEAQQSSEKMGIMWSVDSNFPASDSHKIEAETITPKEGSTTYSYSVNLTGLEPSKTYYFRSYLTQNGQDAYGKTKSFTTLEPSSMLETKDASDLASTSAKMNATLDLTDIQYTTKEYGFYWGTSEESQTNFVAGGEIAENAYSALLSDLSPDSQYWYKSYLKIDGRTFFGEVKGFSTGVQPVTGVSLDKTACTVHTIDSTFALNPTVLPEDATNKAVRWDSSNPSVATVDENGQVTAKGNGSATITVTTEDQGKTATCEVTVAQWVTCITLDQTTLTINEGQTATVSVASITPDNADDKSVTWTSDNPSVATVDQEGTVTAVSGGEANIIATANDGSGKSASCSVTVGVPVTGVSLNYTEYGFKTVWGSVLQLEATVSPSNATDKSVSWKSSNEDVAVVNETGYVIVRGYGEATITVTTNDGGKTATCVIYVSEKVMNITLDKSLILLLEGQETTISVKSIFPDVADKSYTWSSTNTAVASVDENGKISAKAKGTTTIKATANDGGGAYGSCSVQVSDGTVATPDAVDLGLSVKWGSFNLGASAPQERGWYYAWGEILDKTSFSWSNYKWCHGTMDSITKYTSTTTTTHGDGRLSLEIEDDVARTKLGVYWRMPWKSEWEELMRDCTWEWTQQSGVYGFKVTGKKPGYTNNSIFLPAAGYWDENGYRSGSTYVVGYYWSHRLALNTYDAYSFECGHSYADNQNTITSDTNIMRCYGVSIRPVLPPE